MSAKRQAMASKAVAAIADMDLRGLRAEWERRLLAWRAQAEFAKSVTLREGGKAANRTSFGHILTTF